MTKTGFVRKADELGRVVLPIEIRRALEICEKSALVTTMEEDAVVLRRREISCIFCKAKSFLLHIKEKMSAQTALRIWRMLNETSLWRNTKGWFL